MPENEHSQLFWQHMEDMANDFCAVLEGLNLKLPKTERYDVKLLDTALESVRGTVSLYGSGFLPRSFFLSIHSLFDTQGQRINIIEKIKERNDDYFSETLSTFFSPEMRDRFLLPYMDLFHRTDRDGEPLVGPDARAELWDWVDALFITMLEYEHSVRKPVVSGQNGNRTIKYTLHAEETDMLLSYAHMWQVHLYE